MKKLSVMLTLLLLMLAACSPTQPATPTPDIVQTALIATTNWMSESSTQSAAATQTQLAQITPTETSTPVPTLVLATLTPIQPTVPAVMATVLNESNCRMGVYKFFPSLEILKTGTTAAVIGQNTENGMWWKLQTANNQCWVAGNNLSITGDTSKVAVVKSPPTPTPIPALKWDGKWNFSLSSDPANPDGSSQIYTVTLTQKTNELTGSFVASWSSIYMIGYVSSDGMSVSGELYPAAHPDKQYRFFLFRNTDNHDQFRGYYYIEGEGIRGNFCGTVFGAVLPVPCQP